MPPTLPLHGGAGARVDRRRADRHHHAQQRNGLDLAREVRQRQSLPVVLATGYSDQAQAAANEGFSILRKPYSMSGLNDALRGVGYGRNGKGRSLIREVPAVCHSNGR